MWLNQLFTEELIDFHKRCRMRIRVGTGMVVLGLLSLAATVYLKPGADPFCLPSFYRTLGAGLMAGGMIQVLKNRRYLSDPELSKKKAVAENDERNRLLGLRCWAYTGYTMFLVLYVGIFIGGFVSATVVKVLLTVVAVYALLLGGFRYLLGKCM